MSKFILLFESNKLLRVRLVYVFKNWKLLFENICGSTCGCKSALKCAKCCLKTEKCCLKTQTKHPLNFFNTKLLSYLIEPNKITFLNLFFLQKNLNYTLNISLSCKFLLYIMNKILYNNIIIIFTFAIIVISLRSHNAKKKYKEKIIKIK